jgi:DNA-binding LytR/AlgR family response regulator
MNCIVIEDDLLQLELLLNYIDKTESLNLIGSFSCSIDAIKALPNLDLDIVFLDVEMPGMSGIDLLDEYEFPQKTKVILTTSSGSYALKAFDKGVTDYLLKPMTYPRFIKAVNRVVQLKKRLLPSKEYLFVKIGKVRKKVLFDDILWIKSASEYVIIHTLKGNYMVYSSMNDILARLPDSFIRVHRSNIVSISKIEKIHNDVVEINNELIKVSKSYKNDLENRIGI